MRYIYIVFFALLVSCGSVTQSAATKSAVTIAAPEFHSVRVVRKLPHAADSYTQGLLVKGGKFYESTGEYGRSALRVSDIATGKIERQTKLDDRFFGEGLALYEDRFYQLTWMEGACLIYDARTLKRVGSIPYSGEGWGLVAYGDSLLFSDGTSTVRVVDPTTLKTLRSFTVRDDKGEVALVNELEIIDGKLYANIYMSPVIAVIDIDSGVVERYLDCSALFAQIGNPEAADVLNGIAYDQATGKLYVTGKLWDTIFEIALQ